MVLYGLFSGGEDFDELKVAMLKIEAFQNKKKNEKTAFCAMGQCDAEDGGEAA